ncbi:MAG: hypothetical protein B7Y25_01520 [Alphaproteobacteria bacterium 16-39-46]|nr:MAG: hypothetical protein B7Y25_01520 [Alphaproteobacteria bacterium 16-39-46]OZA44095.1 MAG: hypothetical protein B7X84_01505 [Alphaproteobacteria bacterium 17-39-52]
MPCGSLSSRRDFLPEIARILSLRRIESHLVLCVFCFCPPKRKKFFVEKENCPPSQFYNLKRFLGQIYLSLIFFRIFREFPPNKLNLSGIRNRFFSKFLSLDSFRLSFKLHETCFLQK